MDFLLDINPIYFVSFLSFMLFSPFIWGEELSRFKNISLMMTIGFVIMIWMALTSLEIVRELRSTIQDRENKINSLETQLRMSNEKLLNSQALCTNQAVFL